MQKLFLCLLILFCVGVSIPQSAFAFSGNGNGSSGDPYQITTCSHLHEIANNLSGNYLMKNDVNCTGFSFSPIGDTTSNSDLIWQKNMSKSAILKVSKDL